jgi:Outer membrane protein Omp28
VVLNLVSLVVFNFNHFIFIYSIMKKSIIILGLAFIINSCVKEQPPAGLNITQTIIQKDSTYITASIPAKQIKNVLLEELTGVRCANCPVGAAIIKGIETANAPRVIVAKLHSNFLADPIKATDPDLRTDDAQTLSTSLSNSGAKPSSGVDRIYNSVNEPYVFVVGSVAGKVASQLAKATIVNIELEKQLNATKDSITLASKLTFTEATSRKLAYHIYCLENDVEAAQDSLGVEIDGYIHEEILRKCITPAFVGENLPDGPTAAGRVYIRAAQFPKPTKVININNCVMVVFITDRDTKEVLQVQKIHL